MPPVLQWCFLLFIGLATTSLHAQRQAGQSDLLVTSQRSVTDATVSDPYTITGWTTGASGISAFQNPHHQKAYWIKPDSSSILHHGYLEIAGQVSVNVWVISERDTMQYHLGLNQPMHKLPYRGEPEILPLELIPPDVYELIIRVTPYSQQPYPVTLSYLDASQFEQRRLQINTRKLKYHFFLGGGVLALVFLSAFALFQYFESRKKAYLFYGLYMICMALYFGRVLEYHFGEPVFWGFFYGGYGLAEVVGLMLSYVMYVQFTRHFLGIDQKNRVLYLTIRIWIAVCLLIAGIGVILSMLHINSALFLLLYTVLRFAMSIFVVFFLWQVMRTRLPYSRYILLGTVFLLLGGLLALTVTFIFRDFNSVLLREPFFYMLSGVLLESFAFALGLGKQARQTELEKIATQQQLIVQLQKEAQLERDIRETQVQALRAQMNPHFIFNALNSVQHFILDNQKENSIKYLSRVSQLIRRILQNSTLPNIQLDEEIETLKAYVDIEQLRFYPAFSFICTVDENLDIEMIRIPHLMIQPFVENAILHGLVHKKGQGILTLDILPYKEDIAIEVVVTDNGIGREAARKIAAQNPRKHNSISMGSIEARIRLMLPDEMEPLVIEDLKDETGAAAGTRVRLKVPVV